MRSYVAIHLSIILGVGVLITGAIWAKASWGHWWVWDEPVLVSFLVVFLLYCVYYPLRFSIEDPDRQARYSSVFAIAAGAFVPINFMAVRLAETFTHPRVLSQTGGSLPGEMRLTFLVCVLAMTLLFVTLWKLELTSKHASMQLKRLRARSRRGLTDAGAAARRGRQVRGRRLPRVPGAGAGLRGDHRRQDRPHRAASSTSCNETLEERGGDELASCSPSACRTRPRRWRCASGWRCPRAARPRVLAELTPTTPFTRRWRSRPATAPSSTWWPPTRWRPRPRRWPCCRARPSIRAHRAARLALLAARQRGRAPPVLGGRGPRLDDRRRGRDPGPGQARLRAGARGGRHRPDHQPAVPRGAGGRQARAHRDGRRAARTCRCPRWRWSWRPRCSGDLAAAPGAGGRAPARTAS